MKFVMRLTGTHLVKWKNIQEVNFAAEAFRDLYYNFFKI